jgi:hypothetical protein
MQRVYCIFVGGDSTRALACHLHVGVKVSISSFTKILLISRIRVRLRLSLAIESTNSSFFESGRSTFVCYLVRRSLRSGRRDKAWGGAQRNPRNRGEKYAKPAERPTVESSTNDVFAIPTSIGCFRGLCNFFVLRHPGVPLRFTPGFMPSSAPRTKNL